MNNCTKEQLIEFEKGIQNLWEAGELPFLIHLSGGNEDQLIDVFKQAQPGDWFFSTHRNHYHYLLAGGSPKRLTQLICEGNSMFVFDKSINFLSSSVLAGTCGPAVGVAWEIKSGASFSERNGYTRMPHVWCFLGDGAEEQGHFYEALMFAHGHDLPVTFVVENNDRSVDTDIQTRRGAMYDIAIESPKLHRYHYNATFPHAGSGCKTKITFNPEAIARYLASQAAKN